MQLNGWKTPACWAVLLFVSTAGFGLFVPSIEGLGGCEFQVDRLLWAILVWGIVVPCVATAFAVGGQRRFAAGLFLIWPLAVSINVGLEQDPLCAALNWRVQAIDLEDYRDWGLVTSLENHEHVGFDAASGAFFVRKGA